MYLTFSPAFATPWFLRSMLLPQMLMYSDILHVHNLHVQLNSNDNWRYSLAAVEIMIDKDR